MTNDDGDAVDQAIAWKLRLDDASTETWHAFTLWLSGDPARATAFDRIALDDALLPPPRSAVPEAANDDRPGPRRRRLIAAGMGTAVAAAMVAALFVQIRPHRADLLVIDTKPGQSRQLRLADGTAVALNGDSRLTIDRAQPRLAVLDRGQALFTVRHDADHPFELHSGAVVLRDAGTVFDVLREGPRLSVQVSEGALVFRPDGDSVLLQAGSALTLDEAGHRVAVSKVAPKDVGGWRGGQLNFRGEPLAAVAAAVRRSSGADLVLEGDLGALPFTGGFTMQGGAAVAVPRLAALTGSRWRRAGGKWLLSPGQDAAP